MNCDWTQKVSLLIDGELDGREAREVERHVGACGDCRAAREDFLMLRRRIADYPLEHDALARQRALRRILAAGGGGLGIRNETATPPPRARRERSPAGMFGLPRLNPLGLAALLLLLVGAAVGLVSLMSSRRGVAPAEVVTNTPAPAVNTNNGSPALITNTPPLPNDLTASADRPGTRERAGGNNQPRAGTAPVESAGGGAVVVTAAAVDGSRPGRNRRRVERGRGRVLKASPTTGLRFDARRVAVPLAEAARTDVEIGGGSPRVVGAGGGGENTASRGDVEAAGATGASQTARHVEQAQLLLRSFRNARPADAGRRASSDLAHERRRSKKLLYDNIVLRREAASRGNLPVESLLDSLEPILLDIANLPDRPAPADVREINERMRRKNLVAMLQISAVESASPRTY